MSATRVAKGGAVVSVPSLRRSFQPFSATPGTGLGVAGGSSDMSPLRKKSSSGRESSPSPSMIIIVIWKENMSLWRSKMPVHV